MTTTRRTSYYEAKSPQEKILEVMVLDVLKARGITGWTVIFNQDSNKLGYCDYSRREICISRHVVVTDWAEAVDTAMHESAHAVAGHRADHGPEWKRIAAELGARPQAKADYVNRHQTGETKTIRTSYGPVTITVGEHAEVYGKSQFGRIGKLRILEVQRKSFTAESDLGSRYKLPVDFLHPNFGDGSKIIPKTVKMMGRDGHPVAIVLGKSYYQSATKRYVAVEARRRYVLAVAQDGSQLLGDPADFSN